MNADRPTASFLFRTWLGLGIQSFGGGSMTLVLIRHAAIDRYGWITDEQFNKNLALCQLTPGINLLGLTVLIGRQTAGAAGIVACLAGLLLPSAFLTAVLTAGFLSIHKLPWVVAALAGIVPATVGLGLVNACQMAWVPLRLSRQLGHWQLVFSIVLLVGSAMLMWTGAVSVTVVLIAGATLGSVENFIRVRVSARARGE